jgi:hypothetical protein
VLVGFVATIVVRARRGERGWTRLQAVLFGGLILWLVGVTVFVAIGTLTASPHDL